MSSQPAQQNDRCRLPSGEIRYRRHRSGGPRGSNVLIPLVKALTAAVAKDNADADAARYVHWGATSQDVIDTALVLELRVGIDVLVSDLDRAIAAFATLADRHRHTPTVARTWLQHALPMRSA